MSTINCGFLAPVAKCVLFHKKRPLLPVPSRSLSDGPRKIPPPPIQVTFPPCPDLDFHSAAVPEPSQLETLFRVKHIKLLRDLHLQAINLKVENQCSIDFLIPEVYLPPTTWQTKPGTGSEQEKQAGPRSNETLSNGAAVPGHEAFYNRIIELSYNAEDVYDYLARRPASPAQQSVRVTQFRRFWTELQSMGGFWDTSQDNLKYSDPDVQKALEQQEEESSKRVQRLRQSAASSSLHEAPTSPPQDASSPLAPSSPPTSTPEKPHNATEGNSPPSKSSPTAYLTYTGRRHGAGNEMPAKSRDDVVRAFVEPIVWSFGCVVERTASQPYLHVGTTRLTADHAMRIFRGPQDRQRSRAKMLEGPLMALQCTHETAFGNTDPVAVDYIARELGALLVIAQERDREGKTEVIPGVGEWWVERPRWGGGTGEAVGTPILEDDGSEPVIASERKEPSMKPFGPGDSGIRRTRGSRQATKKHLIARSHKPPNAIWERRIDYMRIGKALDDEFDTIYMLSAINHHIAIVRLHVHPRFLALLKRSRSAHTLSEASLDAHFEGEPWYRLELARSRWYDLFLPEDRIEIMRAIWGIMGWLMRETSSVRGPEQQAEKSHRDASGEEVMDTK